MVLERRATADPEAGSYLTVSPNGLDALAAIDALHLVREVGFPVTAQHDVRRHRAPPRRDPARPPLVDDLVALTMKRSRLAVRAADEAERRGVEVRRRARSCRSPGSAGGVTATLEDGTTIAGMCCRADGVHSLVRRTLTRPLPRALVGLTNFGDHPSTPLAAAAPRRGTSSSAAGRSSGAPDPPVVSSSTSAARDQAETTHTSRSSGSTGCSSWCRDDGPAAALVADGS